MKGRKTGGRARGIPNKATRDIKAMAGKYTPEAIATLLRVMQVSESDAAKVSAAKELLDRGHGKASQPITGANDGPIIVEIARFAN